MLLGWERLGEVAILELRPASQLEDALPCHVHYLRRVGGKSAASAGDVTDINHHLLNGMFDAHAAGRFAHRGTQHCTACAAPCRSSRYKAPWPPP